MTNVHGIIRLAAVALAGAALGVACSSGSEGGSSSEITPEDLLAAALSPADIEALFDEPESWWPFFPEFNVGFNPLASEEESEASLFVAQRYGRVAGPDEGEVQTALSLYDDEAAAEEGFRDATEINDEGSKEVEGPAIADQRRYFTRKAEDDSGTPPFEATVRFRVGRVMGRLTVFSERDYESPETLAEYAEPMVGRIQELLEGSFSADPIPKDISELLPSESAAEPAGEIFGSAVRPAQSWAIFDTSGDPEEVLDKLQGFGASELGLRRYGLEADESNVIEVVLFPMEDEDGAQDWVREFSGAVEDAGTLDAGDTGEYSAFSSFDETIYELQFAKGRFAADVSCFAPFEEKPSSACEEAVRDLAEAWYEELPEG